MARAAVAAGADGLLIEVHNDPEHALSDGAQSLEPATVTQLMAELRIIAHAIGRRIAYSFFMTAHLIRRVTILGTGLIGGSFALALRKNLTDIHIHGWDRAPVVQEAFGRRMIDQFSSGSLQAALADADLVYIAVP